ncbi:hypothetical protein BDN71DRAFT_1453367 [Pleurotus eryngii]|uniref:Uncharacterized protein n=1 Tax=Pleurotus eryngii TaxID=5323 RepID=A0A9P6DBW7_PLEER|nr:hypothetical protein BDN71DRAFT_1453367 [Pleurotus eryngii]
MSFRFVILQHSTLSWARGMQPCPYKTACPDSRRHVRSKAPARMRSSHRQAIYKYRRPRIWAHGLGTVNLNGGEQPGIPYPLLYRSKGLRAAAYPAIRASKSSSDIR